MIDFAIAFILAVFHLLSGRMKFISTIPRSIWLSIGGGISTSYVFLHLLPELAAGEKIVGPANTYLLALAGLVTFYGLEKYVKSRQDSRKSEQQAFRVHIASYVVYNFIIGYVLMEEFTGTELYLFAMAIAFHFLVNDYALRFHHEKQYDNMGRWIISGAIVLGAAMAQLTPLPHSIIAGSTSFIGGAVIMNTLKEELPEERKSRFWAFLAGVACYAAVLLTVQTA